MTSLVFHMSNEYNIRQLLDLYSEQSCPDELNQLHLEFPELPIISQPLKPVFLSNPEFSLAEGLIKLIGRPHHKMLHKRGGQNPHSRGLNRGGRAGFTRNGRDATVEEEKVPFRESRYERRDRGKRSLERPKPGTPSHPVSHPFRPEEKPEEKPIPHEDPKQQATPWELPASDDEMSDLLASPPPTHPSYPQPKQAKPKQAKPKQAKPKQTKQAKKAPQPVSADAFESDEDAPAPAPAPAPVVWHASDLEDSEDEPKPAPKPKTIQRPVRVPAPAPAQEHHAQEHHAQAHHAMENPWMGRPKIEQWAGRPQPVPQAQPVPQQAQLPFTALFPGLSPSNPGAQAQGEFPFSGAFGAHAAHPSQGQPGHHARYSAGMVQPTQGFSGPFIQTAQQHVARTSEYLNKPYPSRPEPSHGMQPPALGDATGTRWEYRDTKGIIRGPYTQHRMMRWYQASQLPTNLPIRVCGEAHFTPLRVRWAGYMPFSCPPPPPPPPQHTQWSQGGQAAQIPMQFFSPSVPRPAPAQLQAVAIDMPKASPSQTHPDTEWHAPKQRRRKTKPDTKLVTDLTPYQFN